VGVILALGCALIYGAADFLGGLATKRSAVWTVVVLTSLVGLITALALVPLMSPGPPPPRDLVLGVFIGLASGSGFVAFYQGLAVSRMSIVAPITAVLAAVVPVLYGTFRGEHLSVFGITGIALALIAVFLVSRASDEDVAGQSEPARWGWLYGLAAGLTFGLIFVLLSATSRGVWPLVMSRVVNIVLVGGLALITGRLSRPARSTYWMILLAGSLDMIANVTYLLSLRYTLISIAAVVTSLYPASTVMLARFVLHERLGPIQWVGVGCALVGVVLLSTA
jgi:drug/metabolite transporter (DMT)-like permease